jgi:hypothetical protein
VGAALEFLVVSSPNQARPGVLGVHMILDKG